MTIFAQFRFIDEAPERRAFHPLRSQLFEVEEHEMGREHALKLWQKTGTERDEDLRLIWRHEMRQVERVMATASAQEVIVDVLEVLEDESYFGILLDDTGAPLEALLEQVTSRPLAAESGYGPCSDPLMAQCHSARARYRSGSW